jgi:hypothetical protein
MASTFLIETRDSGKAVCQRQKFHISRLISMNGFARFDDESGRRDRHWRLPFEKDFAMNGTAGFLIAVGGVSAIIYWLMSRAENRAARRSSTGAGAGSDYSYDSGSSIGGWSLTNWYSSSSSSTDSSSSSSASGSWDSGSSGGGGDSGGGGGDSGGGSD